MRVTYYSLCSLYLPPTHTHSMLVRYEMMSTPNVLVGNGGLFLGSSMSSTSRKVYHNVLCILNRLIIRVAQLHYQCLILFNVVNTLPCSTLIFNVLTISVRRYARRYVGILFFIIDIFFPHILTNTQFKHVTSIYYHS